jgi:hypothetical protein
MVNSSLLAACRAAHSESFRGKSTQIPFDEYVTTKIGPFLSGSIKANQGAFHSLSMFPFLLVSGRRNGYGAARAIDFVQT